MKEHPYALGPHPPPLMAADEEFERARTVRALRREAWRLAVRLQPQAVLDRIARAPRRLTTRLQRIARGKAGERAREAAITELCEHDLSGELLTALVDVLDDAALRSKFAAYNREKHHFVLANIGLVFKLAHRHRARGLGLHDLVQEGCLGLLRAVDMFDPDRGFRFSTYAVWWVRHAIGRAITDRSRTIRVPVHLSTLHLRMLREAPRLRKELGREPTRPELARACGVTEERIRLARKAFSQSMVSLNQPRRSDAEPIQLIDEDPSDALDLHIAARGVGRLLDDLEGIEADVVRKRFGIERPKSMTLQEIGDEYALSRERIRQIELKALAKMREALGVKVGL